MVKVRGAPAASLEAGLEEHGHGAAGGEEARRAAHHNLARPHGAEQHHPDQAQRHRHRDHHEVLAVDRDAGRPQDDAHEADSGEDRAEHQAAEQLALEDHRPVAQLELAADVQ